MELIKKLACFSFSKLKFCLPFLLGFNTKWETQLNLEAKYQVPRDPNLRSCYRASKLHRPKLKIHGAWCFGYTLQLAILEETTYHGSSMVLEVLMMTLEAVMSQRKESNQPCPDTLIVVSDNTVKEFKNSPCLTYLASLVNHGRLRFLGQAMNKGPGVFGSR